MPSIGATNVQIAYLPLPDASQQLSVCVGGGTQLRLCNKQLPDVHKDFSAVLGTGNHVC